MEERERARARRRRRRRQQKSSVKWPRFIVAVIVVLALLGGDRKSSCRQRVYSDV